MTKMYAGLLMGAGLLTVVSAGEGYVDTGHGHIGLNQSGQAASGVTGHSHLWVCRSAPSSLHLDLYCGF